MRVLLDIDGVLADWGSRYDELAAELPFLELGGKPFSEVDSWDMTRGLSPAALAIHKNIMADPRFYWNLPLVDGAMSAFAALDYAGIDVWFVSTPDPTNAQCAPAKIAWINSHFGGGAVTRLILTHDKTLIDGDVLLDDKPIISGANSSPHWEHLCFGNYAYSHLTESERAYNWDDALRILGA